MTGIVDQADTGLMIEELSVARGGFPVVRGVTLHAPPGQVTVLLGPNGAGKTTLLEAVSGVIPVSGGQLRLNGTVITAQPREARARRGLAHVEQGRTVFAGLSVEDNLRAAGRGRSLDELFGLFPELIPRRTVAAGMLSGGEQQMVVIARALAGRPQVLLVDELSLGLAPIVVRRLMPVLRGLADDGVGVLLVEQFAALALDIGDHAYVLNRGEVVHAGRADELRRRPELLRGAYLGASASPSAPSPASQQETPHDHI
ncbi:ABC transporter ATP-binding protein [Deinococcus frigens]|uniref:ABC transporter ATP-binding protein n=1 Tax=Deinococcus frigens TaxID=249403 RepID=UPI00068C03B2|nr:ABC transporter ATP-binding protein [Deinococcus frigens]